MFLRFNNQQNCEKLDLRTCIYLLFVWFAYWWCFLKPRIRRKPMPAHPYTRQILIWLHRWMSHCKGYAWRVNNCIFPKTYSELSSEWWCRDQLIKRTCSDLTCYCSSKDHVLWNAPLWKYMSNLEMCNCQSQSNHNMEVNLAKYILWLANGVFYFLTADSMAARTVALWLP